MEVGLPQQKSYLNAVGIIQRQKMGIVAGERRGSREEKRAVTQKEIQPQAS